MKKLITLILILSTCDIFAQVLPTPTGTPEADAAVTLGMKFQPINNSVVTGLMYYRNFSGTVTGQLWNSNGLLLASVTFSDNSAGWKQANFSGVNVSKDSVYTISYHTGSGTYYATANYFPRSFPKYTATGSAYRYGAVGFPQTGYLNSNYYVEPIINDVVVTPPPSGYCDTLIKYVNVYVHDTVQLQPSYVYITDTLYQIAYVMDTVVISDTIAYERNSMFSDSALNQLLWDDAIYNYEFTIGNKKLRFIRQYMWVKEEEINGFWIKK